MTALVFTILVVIFLALLALFLFIFPIIQVCGDSMFPTYTDGETLLSYRLLDKNTLKSGDVVLAYSPTEKKKRIIVKRVMRVKKDYNGNVKEVFLVGDNKEVSYDSRYYGYVSVKKVFAKVKDQRKRKTIESRYDNGR